MMFRNVQLKVKEAIGRDPWFRFRRCLPCILLDELSPKGPALSAI
jgi:hypothetical protein